MSYTLRQVAILGVPGEHLVGLKFHGLGLGVAEWQPIFENHPLKFPVEVAGAEGFDNCKGSPLPILIFCSSKFWSIKFSEPIGHTQHFQFSNVFCHALILDNRVSSNTFLVHRIQNYIRPAQINESRVHAVSIDMIAASEHRTRPGDERTQNPGVHLSPRAIETDSCVPPTNLKSR